MEPLGNFDFTSQHGHGGLFSAACGRWRQSPGQLTVIVLLVAYNVVLTVLVLSRSGGDTTPDRVKQYTNERAFTSEHLGVSSPARAASSEPATPGQAGAGGSESEKVQYVVFTDAPAVPRWQTFRSARAEAISGVGLAHDRHSERNSTAVNDVESTHRSASFSPSTLAALDETERLRRKLQTLWSTPHPDVTALYEIALRKLEMEEQHFATSVPKREVFTPVVSPDARRRGMIPSIEEDIMAHADYVHGLVSQKRGSRVAWFWRRRILEKKNRLEAEFLRRYAATGDELTSRYLVLAKLQTPHFRNEPSETTYKPEAALAHADP